MKNVFIVLFSFFTVLFAQNIEEIIANAEKLANEKNLVEAIEILENAIIANPQSADLLAEYGLYLSQRAGEVSFLKAGLLSTKAFKQLDKALEYDPNHIKARLYRGILAVNVPKFMGKLKLGIKDLEKIQSLYGDNKELYLVSSYYLGMGYQKADRIDDAIASYKFVIMYGKDSSYYESAKAQYDKLSEHTGINSTENAYEQAMGFYESGNLEKAVENFKIATQESPNNLEMHLLYARTLGELAAQGYDESIQEDVTAMAEIAHDVFEVLSHCVELAPDNDEIRFLRASVSIQLPFFVESLETGISDLEFLASNSKDTEIKQNSKNLLTKALKLKDVDRLAKEGYKRKDNPKLRKELLKQFIEADYKLIQPKPNGKYAKIEIQLGYRDQIAPQCAVWIEDIEGNYITTIYVSGFAGKVKEKQEHLPKWANSSKFRNIDLVTSASIDSGKHVLYWDFKDFQNNLFSKNKFVVNVEICHWPHVQYQKQSIIVDRSKDNNFHSNGDSYLIPNLEITLSE